MPFSEQYPSEVFWATTFYVIFQFRFRCNLRICAAKTGKTEFSRYKNNKGEGLMVTVVKGRENLI